MNRIIFSVSAWCIALIISLFSSTVLAANKDVTINLRPHCETTQCSEFILYDQETSITNGLKIGDTLDVDVVVQNPSGQPLQSVRSWLEYDASVLEGIDVRISDKFPLVAPGEQTFSVESGRVKLGASNITGGMQEQEFVFARVRFKVLSEPDTESNIVFHEFSLLGQEGKTEILLIEGGRTVDVLITRPRSLRLYFGDDPPPTLIPNQPTQPTQPIQPTNPNQPVSPTQPNQPNKPSQPIIDPSFAVLQPQGLRVITEEDKVYLVWNSLQDSRVVGYNLYYGTTSGRYIQRRTVSSDTNGVTVRNLPAGQRYYFALTAFNSNGQDSEYSYEVAVTVGDPNSSTAPFTLTAIDGVPIDGSVITGGVGHVPGGTGMPILAVFVITFVALASSAALFFFRKRSRIIV